jgi:hypothetical protein
VRLAQNPKDEGAYTRYGTTLSITIKIKYLQRDEIGFEGSGNFSL